MTGTGKSSVMPDLAELFNPSSTASDKISPPEGRSRSMNSLATPDFWQAYARLPAEIKALAKRAYRIWSRNPRHPSLCFKKVGELWAIRIGLAHRAVAIQQDNTFYWFWIGSHDEYERLVRLR